MNGGPVVGPIKVDRAYEQLARLLRERIAAGDLREGDRLPSETAIAEQAGVSRSTVREALRTLEEAGLVERASPRTMVVADRSDTPAFRELRRELHRHRVTFRQLHEALMTFEPELARFAALRASPRGIELLQEHLAEQDRQLDRLDEWSRLDVEFHGMLASLSGNPALAIARQPIAQLLLPTLYSFMETREMAEHATGYHRRIVAEIEQRDPDTAAAVMRRHIDDWRTAWEKQGLDLDQPIPDVDAAGSPTTTDPT